MNENEFWNVYISNSFKLMLVLPIIYSYYNIFFSCFIYSASLQFYIFFYIVKAQFSFTAASFSLQ